MFIFSVCCLISCLYLYFKLARCFWELLSYIIFSSFVGGLSVGKDIKQCFPSFFPLSVCSPPHSLLHSLVPRLRPKTKGDLKHYKQEK